jgi:hypothetical protein
MAASRQPVTVETAHAQLRTDTAKAAEAAHRRTGVERPMNAAHEPGHLARLAAALITDAGLDVKGPDPDDTDGRRLFISCPGGPYSLVISDDAHAELQGDAHDPHHAADIAAALLSPTPSSAPRPHATPHPGLTLNGNTGQDHKSKGVNVALDK